MFLCILDPEVLPKVICILTKKMQYRKVYARCVSQIVTVDHKRQLVDSSREFIHHCAYNEVFFDSIVTGDQNLVIQPRDVTTITGVAALAP